MNTYFLQEILKKNIVQYDKEKNIIQYYIKNDGFIDVSLPEFANLCKFWVLKYGFVLSSFQLNENIGICRLFSQHEIINNVLDEVKDISETMAIIKCSENLFLNFKNKEIL